MEIDLDRQRCAERKISSIAYYWANRERVLRRRKNRLATLKKNPVAYRQFLANRGIVCRKYRLKNHERILEKQRAWAKSHREKRRAWHRNNREWVRAYKKKYWNMNKEWLLIKMRIRRKMAIKSPVAVAA